MADTTKILQRMEIVGSCGTHVGRVECIERDQIRLTHAGQDGHRHYIPLDWVEGVGQTVRLSKTNEEARPQWRPIDDTK